MTVIHWSGWAESQPKARVECSQEWSKKTGGFNIHEYFLENDCVVSYKPERVTCPDCLAIIKKPAKILGLFNQYRPLSNFEMAPVWYDGLEYSNNECAYQAAKVLDQENRRECVLLTPTQAKKWGQQVNLRSDWEQVKLSIMTQINETKFINHLYLAKILLDTGDAYIEESNWWNDKYWGVCFGVGENNLGKILMNIRSKISKIKEV